MEDYFEHEQSVVDVITIERLLVHVCKTGFDFCDVGKVEVHVGGEDDGDHGFTEAEEVVLGKILEEIELRIFEQSESNEAMMVLQNRLVVELERDLTVSHDHVLVVEARMFNIVTNRRNQKNQQIKVSEIFGGFHLSEE